MQLDNTYCSVKAKILFTWFFKIFLPRLRFNSDLEDTKLIPWNDLFTRLISFKMQSIDYQQKNTVLLKAVWIRLR